jgi:hypothetical protein
MKKSILLLLLCFVINISAQIDNKVEITGQIVVEGDDLEDITIYNITSGLGTLTNAKGEFRITVKRNDTLQVRALQYQNFDVIINEAIIESRRLSVFLIQEINKLDEIVLRNRKFSGELSADLKSVKTFTPKMDAIYFGVRQEPQLNESSADFTRNDILLTNATSQNKPLVNGLNVINVVDQLLLPLFRSKVKDKKKIGVPEVPVDDIKYYFGAEFLTSNFNIPQHRVEEFIGFVEQQDFDFSLLNYGRELEFLELLNQKSIAFLKQKTATKD